MSFKDKAEAILLKYGISSVQHKYWAKALDQLNQAHLEAVREIIGEDDEHAPVETLGTWSHDIAHYEYNHLRKRQRERAGL